MTPEEAAQARKIATELLAIQETQGLALGTKLEAVARSVIALCNDRERLVGSVEVLMDATAFSDIGRHKLGQALLDGADLRNRPTLEKVLLGKPWRK